MCRRYVWNVQPKHFSPSLALKETDQRVCSLALLASNFSQLADTYCKVFCLWLDRLTHREQQQQQQLSVCPSTFSSVSIFSLGTGSLVEVRHLSHLELRARQPAVKLPQASSKKTDPAVTESALATLQCHFLREANHYKKKKKTQTKVKQSRAIQNLKYAVSRWGASFSAEVNVAGFVKTTAFLPQSQEGQLKCR